jgi:hypothetical protein|tara:strand:+ start:179 stop:310 length:132 start_codon:yes stop_codon:yes gene_type:complete
MEEDMLWYAPELLVPSLSKPKEILEKTISDYLGEDDEQNLGDC